MIPSFLENRSLLPTWALKMVSCKEGSQNGEASPRNTIQFIHRGVFLSKRNRSPLHPHPPRHKLGLKFGGVHKFQGHFAVPQKFWCLSPCETPRADSLSILSNHRSCREPAGSGGCLERFGSLRMEMEDSTGETRLGGAYS